MDENVEILFCQLLRHKADGTLSITWSWPDRQRTERPRL